jgi:mycothione reductase
MKAYPFIIIGTGSALSVGSAMIDEDREIKIAVIDKDEPGGICLTRGCIPSKLLTYPAELIRLFETYGKFGIEGEIKKIDFRRIMDQMRANIGKDIDALRSSLDKNPNIDYYRDVAEFIAPHTLKVGKEVLKGEKILLGTGSRPFIPPIKGLEEQGYLTSDTVLKMKERPESLAIMGGGYIASEYGHFFSAMGSEVTIIGRNPHFLPDEEPEVSDLAKKEMSRHMTVLTNHEVLEVKEAREGEKRIIAVNRASGKKVERVAGAILVAAGRRSNSDLLHPEKGNIRTDPDGWIEVNEFLETSQPDVWALGDADGKYPFKHKANYEAQIVYYNAVLKKKIKADYRAIPHAIFSFPEIASVGLKEKEAVSRYGEENVLLGFHRFEDTAKGDAMAVKDYFVKVLVEKESGKVLGAHIIGPYASLLIQEVVTLMYTPEPKYYFLAHGMHIHPALSEVVEKAFQDLMPPPHYHHLLKEHFHLEP